MAASIDWCKQVLEYLGGAVDEPPRGFPLAPTSILWGVWWGVLIGLIVMFCGQSSKFIYIDF